MAPVNYGRALYYPYIHIQSETWLKKALLYYDGLDTITPKHDVADPESPEEERIREIEKRLCRGKDPFLRRVSPIKPAEGMQDEFLEFVLDHLTDEKRRSSLLREIKYRIKPGSSYRIHPDKLAPELRKELFGLGLAQQLKQDPDIDLEPLTGSLYMVFLAKRVALPNGLPIVSDTTIFQRLIYKQLPARVASTTNAVSSDVGFTLASFVIPSLIPKRLGAIPIDEIIDIRNDTEAQRQNFYSKVSELGKGLEGIDSKAAMKGFLERKHKEINRSVEQLEASLNTVGITCARNIIGLSIPTFATSAWFAGALGLSTAVTGPLGVALMMSLTIWLAKREHDKTYRDSPWSYVLTIRNRLDEESLLRQMAQGAVLI